MAMKTINDLHPNTMRIVRAIRSATRILKSVEHVVIVGSLAKMLDGNPPVAGVGDVEILLDKPLCENYWQFLEILGLHGLHSMYDVWERPDFDWKPYRIDIGHAKLLSVDCFATYVSNGFKHATLDIVFKADDIVHITGGSTWAEEIPWQHLKSLTKDQILKEIDDQNKRLVDAAKNGESNIPPFRRFCTELGLFFGSDSDPAVKKPITDCKLTIDLSKST